MRVFKYIKYSVSMATLLLAFALISCESELDKRPETELTEDQVFADQASYKEFLARVYAGIAVSGQEGPAGDPDIRGIDEGFSNYLRQFWKHQELNTDEAIIAWNDGTIHDLHNHVWTASNEFIRAMYDRIYFQIGITNQYLRETTDEKLDGRNVDANIRGEIKNYRAEARFMRALSYWHALDFYGPNIPFVRESDPVGNFFPEPGVGNEIFDFIESELLAIEADLVGAGQNEYGRADKGAAWMLLAKLYLNAEVYTGAAKYSEAMENINKVLSAGYSLSPEYENLFLADNDWNGAQNEIIFPIRFDGANTLGYGGTTFLTHAAVGGKMNPADYGVDGGWGGLRTTKNMVQLFSGLDTESKNEAIGPVSHWGLVGSATVNGWNGPDMSMHQSGANQYGIYASLVAGEIKFRENNSWDPPNVNLGDNGADGSLEPGGANIAIPMDATYYITLNTGNNTYQITPIGDVRGNFFTEEQNLEIDDPFKFSDGYAVVKFKNLDVDGNPGSSLTFMDIDFPMFRLADAYLMYAEVFVRIGAGDAATARDYINELRERAYGSDAGNISATDLNLDFILDERSRELHWEGHRRTDLIRFGKFTTSGVWPWKGGVKEGKTTESFRDIYPIPSTDIIANPNLAQNEGY